jgi:hypothetical protein
MSQYRKGYLFEKKTHQEIADIISSYKYIKFYGIESRGSKGTADIVFGLYDSKKRKRIWIGIQCKRGYVSKPEKDREIKGAMKDYGMIMFYSTPLKEKKTKIEFYPDFKEWLERWIKKI